MRLPTPSLSFELLLLGLPLERLLARDRKVTVEVPVLTTSALPSVNSCTWARPLPLTREVLPELLIKRPSRPLCTST